ncbi:MAG: potassium/proton antiporter [Planctomycetia bacterium]|nr:potassium/proton antiporter [Planctomycetia bacterium]
MPEMYWSCTIAAILIFLGIFGSKVSSFLQIPILLVFLIIGMLAGSDGLGGIVFEDYAAAGNVGTIALMFILFSGGYDTSWQSIRKVLFRGTLLSTLGVFLTAVFIGLFTAWWMEWPLPYGLLLGAIVSSTDAAAVFAIFRSKSVGLKGDLRPILEYESGSNDPMATFLTFFMIQMIATSSTSYLTLLPQFFQKIGVGVVVGFLVAKAIVWLINRAKLEYDGLYYVIGIATVLLSYGTSEICSGNGFMSVYVSGLVFGNSRFIYKHGLGRFHDGIAWLMQVVMFLTLGLLVSPNRMAWDWSSGVLIAFFIMLVARPLCVFLCLLGSSFHWREQLLISWGGIRGAAPIVLAIFPCLAFQNTPNADFALTIFHLVFFIVILSVLIQGKTLMPLARWLGVDEVARAKPRAPLEFEETGRSRSRMYEFEITHDSPIAGAEIKNIGFPGGALVYLIRRDGLFVVPNGSTVIQVEDELMMMMEPEMLPEVATLFGNNGNQ